MCTIVVNLFSIYCLFLPQLDADDAEPKFDERECHDEYSEMHMPVWPATSLRTTSKLLLVDSCINQWALQTWNTQNLMPHFCLFADTWTHRVSGLLMLWSWFNYKSWVSSVCLGREIHLWRSDRRRVFTHAFFKPYVFQGTRDPESNDVISSSKLNVIRVDDRCD